MANLTLQNVSKNIDGFKVIEPVNLVFPTGELTAVLGPSGCGKTTLLRLIAGLEAPSTGSIFLDDKDITEYAAHRRKFGMVFQSLALFKHLNVIENVSYSLKIAGIGRLEREKRALHLLDMVQLAPLAQRHIAHLSGGQSQRVAIARALAQSPEVFLLDEPLSALDAKLREEMQLELRALQKKLGITTVLVTHDQREAMTVADRVIVMSNGRVEQTGTPHEIYNNPRNEFVASFIGRANFFDGIVRDNCIDLSGSILIVDYPICFPEGSLVTVAIRPERVRFGTSLPEFNQLNACVNQLLDVGSTCELHVDTSAGSIMIGCVASAHATFPSVGDKLKVHLPSNSLHIFPRNEREALASEFQIRS